MAHSQNGRDLASTKGASQTAARFAASTKHILHTSECLTDLLTSRHASQSDPDGSPAPILPSNHAITTATRSIFSSLPSQGLGLSTTASHLMYDLTPGLNLSSLSPRFYGLVTGGITPAARFAEHIVSTFDQNVSVHLPSETLATGLEDKALRMLCQLFDLFEERFVARTLTTGATGSNVLGLASGREFGIRTACQTKGVEYVSDRGILGNCMTAGIRAIRVLTTCPHSSLGKAASVVGLGSGSLVDVGVSTTGQGGGIQFDMIRLEKLLAEQDTVNILAVSCSEVNQGSFATNGEEEMAALRALCNKYGAWLHVDAAFGIFASLLPSTNPSYTYLRTCSQGLHHADSITTDGHKLLNVPYDTGIFLSAHSDISHLVFSNPNAPYLSSTTSDGLVSPLNLGLENSRRWRALPVYATLLAYGREGYGQMVERMVCLARGTARFIRDECGGAYELLIPDGQAGLGEGDGGIERVFMIVAFRARDEVRNRGLVQRIKEDGRIYCSGTVLQGKPAARMAVAKWDVDVERDLAVVKSVLRDVA